MPLSPRATEIRKDLVKLRDRCRLWAEDYLLDWLAESVAEDEAAGLYVWPTKEKKSK